jgi:hypothetical protein
MRLWLKHLLFPLLLLRLKPLLRLRAVACPRLARCQERGGDAAVWRDLPNRR